MTDADAQATPFARIEAAFADPLATARVHKQAGGKVIGYLGATVPAELIAAAGAYPLRIKGSSGDTELADELMEPVRELYLRRVFNQALAGELEWLDLLIVPRSSEGLLQFYYLLDYVRTHHDHKRLPKFVLLDLLQTPFEYTIRYNIARLQELKAEIEAVTGNIITDQALSAEIIRYNEARAQMRNFVGRNLPNGSLRLKLASFGQTQPLAEFQSVLAELTNTPDLRAKAARPVILSGSSHETAILYGLFAENGMDIVLEDHDWGARIYAHDVAENTDPLAALEKRYREHGISMRQFIPAKPELDLTNKPVDASLIAFFFEENDDTLGWDYPDERQRLGQAGYTTGLLRGPVDAPACAAAIKKLAAELNDSTGGQEND